MTTHKPAPAPVGRRGPADDPRDPAPATREAPAPPPHEERASVRLVATRLKSAHPAADPAHIDALVETAYDELRGARVRTFIPILVERRAKSLLTESHSDNAPAAASPP